MTWPEAGALTYGETLRESVLTGGDQQGKGTYAWKTPEAIPTVENTGCTVVFTPDDPNYAPVEHTVSVAVAPRELTIAGVTAQNRVYDPDSTAVTLTGGSLDESAIVIRDGVPDDAGAGQHPGPGQHCRAGRRDRSAGNGERLCPDLSGRRQLHPWRSRTMSRWTLPGQREAFRDHSGLDLRGHPLPAGGGFGYQRHRIAHLPLHRHPL